MIQNLKPNFEDDCGKVDLFNQTLKDINAAMNESINRISLQIQDESNIRRSLRHSFLDDLLSRINEGVSVLAQLVDRSIGAAVVPSTADAFLRLGMAQPNFKPTLTVDLCKSITQPIEPGTETSCGIIFDASTPETYTYHVSSIILSKYRAQGGRTIIPLNEVLGQSRRHMILSENDRLKLATVISPHLIQLHGSPWMPKVIRSRDIYLIQREDDPICDCFFVMQTLPNTTGPCVEENTELSSMRNQASFYLGVLLIELAFGKSLELLQSERDKSSTGSQFFTDYRTAKRLIDQVKSFIGPNYGTAVSRCIDGEFHCRGVGLEDQDLSHDVYAGVVALLEKELEG
ncbi:hypothetical protein FACUT_10640 [Fusarium acutatum]|uniref:DUF7580 domain-containing protein n=1 Tax=Fusarium acutatum TaxID=78861 RepID=A0A8H4JHI4_9HYPO|nr:hypothetical protein FACUT_10640 [Fusarium acutatum]